MAHEMTSFETFPLVYVSQHFEFVTVEGGDTC